MALEGEFLAEVEHFTAELTAAGRGVILDAATGAGVVGTAFTRG